MPRALSIVLPFERVDHLDYALELLVSDNAQYVESLPELYSSGVTYRWDRACSASLGACEQFFSAPLVYARGHGACGDLACWRAAELRARGVAARAVARDSSTGWHVVVLWPDASVEDPSVALGM